MRAQPKRPLQAAGSGFSSHPETPGGAWTGARRDRGVAPWHAMATLEEGGVTGERPCRDPTLRRHLRVSLLVLWGPRSHTCIGRAVLGSAEGIDCSQELPWKERVEIR